MLRTHQWSKNFLLFVPLLAAHWFLKTQAWHLSILAFFSFSLCASAAYIINDLLDLETDRLHPRKRNRPIAAGLVPIWLGIIFAPLLLLLSLTLGFYVGEKFLFCLGIYFILTCSYSLFFKQIVLLDCLILAVLYTLRIIAGALAINMILSFWLLDFSVFLFLSLAFVKRYAELKIKFVNSEEKIHGRAYYSSDASLIQIMGVSSGYLSVLVLALYLNSEAIEKLYRSPQCIWGAVLILLFWISWVWIQAHRGKMHDDPLIFALQDKASLFAGLLFVFVLMLGMVAWL